MAFGFIYSYFPRVDGGLGLVGLDRLGGWVGGWLVGWLGGIGTMTNLKVLWT